MPPEFFWIDAFATRPFTGNPTIVFLLHKALYEERMRCLACEFSRTETAAFVWPGRDGEFSLRWFHGETELSLCGHATIAAAKALWLGGWVPETETITFSTQSGTLRAEANDSEEITVSLPGRVSRPTEVPSKLLNALGLEPHQVRWCGKDVDDYLLLLGSDSEVESVAPDFHVLKDLDARGIIVTASHPKEYDFVSRVFTPGQGVERYAIASQFHSTLGPFWADQLGRENLAGWQATARGGQVLITINGDRVELTGPAKMVVRGDLTSELLD